MRIDIFQTDWKLDIRLHNHSTTLESLGHSGRQGRATLSKNAIVTWHITCFSVCGNRHLQPAAEFKTEEFVEKLSRLPWSVIDIFAMLMTCGLHGSTFS